MDTSANQTHQKLLYSSGEMDSFVDALAHVDKGLPQRVGLNPENVERGLSKLVLTLIEFLRQLMERQALHRMDRGTLTEEEIECLGLTFMKLEERLEELKRIFGLEDEDLNLNLGPLGDLL